MKITRAVVPSLFTTLNIFCGFLSILNVAQAQLALGLLGVALLIGSVQARTRYDNVNLSEFCSPPLTTVHIPRERIGHIICDCLIPQRGKTILDQEIVIDPEFILRDSTGPAPAR